MAAVIMDSCSYTRQGLTAYLESRSVEKRNIYEANSANELTELCELFAPHVVFISEECFIHSSEQSQQLKRIICQHNKTLFFVFMAITNAGFDTYLRIRENLLITSKSIKPEFIDNLLEGYFEKGIECIDNINMPILTLSKTEYSILKMWMSGQTTLKISDKMNVKTKTVSSHKGNIKRKTKTHNKKVIYHVVRLTDNITNGIIVNAC